MTISTLTIKICRNRQYLSESDCVAVGICTLAVLAENQGVMNGQWTN